MLSVSVVVPIRNAARTLPSCLMAMEKLDPAPLEIILVDNGSSDGSLFLLHAFTRNHAPREVKVLEEPRRGAAVTRNTGMREAKGDVIAFTDSDCAPDPSWLRHLISPFEDPAVGAVAGRIVGASAASTLELFSALYTFQLPDHPVYHRCWTPWEGGYPTANFAIRRTMLQELHGFDESIVIYGEDYDLCARLYARGAAIAYVPEARVVHHHRGTLTGVLRQAFGFGRSHAYLLHRHAPGGLWMDLPWRSSTWQGSPVQAWVDLAAADKKMLAILGLGILDSHALWLLPLYGVWLATAVGRQARRAGTTVSAPTAIELAGLLLLKSAAMTAGRWWGSVRYGAICI